MVLPGGPVRAHVPSSTPSAQRRTPDCQVPREQAQGGLFLQVQVQTWIPCARLLSEVKEVSGAANTDLQVLGSSRAGSGSPIRKKCYLFLFWTENPFCAMGILKDICINCLVAVLPQASDFTSLGLYFSTRRR